MAFLNTSIRRAFLKLPNRFRTRKTISHQGRIQKEGAEETDDAVFYIILGAFVTKR